jgi:multidrug efflux pump subunit AcrA (membrane-fusion protein)
MLPKRFQPAAKLLPGPVIVAAAAWWGPSSVGIGQPVATRSPADVKSVAGRVEGGSEGASATGTIAELLVRAGARVQAGQQLVRVECSAIERELEARKTDLAAAQSLYLRTLLAACYRDFGPLYERLAAATDIEPFEVIADDEILTRGTLAYFNKDQDSRSLKAI